MEWSVGGFSVAAGLYTCRMLGAGVKWLVTYFTGRFDKQQEHLDAGVNALIEGLRTEMNRMKLEAIEDRREIAEGRRESAEIRLELRECERKHSASEAKVAKLEAMYQGYGDAKQLAALQAAADKLEAKS